LISDFDACALPSRLSQRELPFFEIDLNGIAAIDDLLVIERSGEVLVDRAGDVEQLVTGVDGPCVTAEPVVEV
jgi:hypothetical protein